MAGNSRSGRKATPDYLKLIKGTNRKDRVNDQAPAEPPLLDVPKVPVHMKGKLARKEWRRVAPKLVQHRLLTEMDLRALEGYCVAYDNYVTAQRCLEELGSTIVVYDLDDAGQQRLFDDKPIIKKIVRNPAIITVNQCLRVLQAFCTDFGMTPMARQKIKVDHEP